MATAYLKTLGLTILILSIPFCLGFLFLGGSGELLEVHDVALHQTQWSENSDRVCIAGSALFPLSFHYKQALYQQNPAAVIALGSSRVMQFRESFFNDSFINMGGSMSSLEEGLELVDNLLQYSEPDLVIIGVDIWWFNESYAPPQHWKKPYVPHIPSAQQLLKYVEWLADGKIRTADITTNLGWSADLTLKCGIGIPGRLNQTGFAADGSYYATSLVVGQTPHPETRHFNDTLARIKNGEQRFEYGEIANDEKIDALVQIVNELQGRRIDVSLFFPPFAPTVYKEMAREPSHYSYVKDLKTKLTERGVSYNDFSDPATLSSNDCEFLDGFHGGDLVYAKILLKIADSENSINKFINREILQQATNRYKEIAFIPDARVTSQTEVDFLRLGCNKASGYLPKH